MSVKSHAMTVLLNPRICRFVGVSVEFINRELSWLDFNERVLRLTDEPHIPLLERLKFIAIYSSNLDEFFQVRVGALRGRMAAGINQPGFDGLTVDEQLSGIRRKVLSLSGRRDSALSSLLTELSSSGIRVLEATELTPADQQWIDSYFDAMVLPMLTPLAVDPTHPFPYISNLALNIGVMVSDPYTGEERFARVKVPTNIPRFVALGDGRFVPLEIVLGERIDRLFPGMNVSRPNVFRVTRNTDLTIDADEAEDLLEAVEMELRKRRFGDIVRLEVEDSIDDRVLQLLLEELEIDAEGVYRHRRLLNAVDLWEVHRIPDPHLHDEPWKSVVPGRLSAALDKDESFFSVLRHRDLMVHHPYESFASSTEEFIQQAAIDPKVRSIKATLYRVSADSPIARSLVAAAERGVQVAVLVELTARFDEQTNVRWAKELERAGAHVIYGMVGLKTHAKCILVVRDEGQQLRRYAHIGTGNYNSATARVYEDIGIFTADPVITEDVANLFNYLTGYSHTPFFKELITAPDDLRPKIVSLIRNEAGHGEKGRIDIKVNSLVDEEIIRELDDAVAKGVSVNLLIRGICSMRPRAEEAANLRVRSVLGRYLEHSRVYRFAHGDDEGAPAYYIGSADMMTRNLDLRVEVLTPIRHPKHRSWIDKIFEIYWRDDVVRFDLRPNGEWQRAGNPDFSFEHDAQGQMMAWATDLQTVNGLPSQYDLDDTGGSLRTRPGTSWERTKRFFDNRWQRG